MKKTKITVLLFLFGVFFPKAQAQESVGASGGNAAGSGGTVSYSVGQVVYTVATGPNGSVSQGVQQPFEIFPLGVDDFPNISLIMTAYPNPVTSMLNLKIENTTLDFPGGKLECQLYDLQGRLIANRKIIGAETQIDMGNLAAATYFLMVLDNSKPLKTFKIIKNN